MQQLHWLIARCCAKGNIPAADYNYHGIFDGFTVPLDYYWRIEELPKEAIKLYNKAPTKAYLVVMTAILFLTVF